MADPDIQATAADVMRPPLSGPLIANESGAVLLLQPNGTHAWVHLDQGLTLGWMPLAEGAILLSLRDAHCKSDGLAVTLSHDGLRGLIADLRSIDAQLEESVRCG